MGSRISSFWHHAEPSRPAAPRQESGCFIREKKTFARTDGPFRSQPRVSWPRAAHVCWTLPPTPPATARATAPPGLALLTRFIIYPSVCVRRQDIFWLAARREALKIGAKEKRQAGCLRRLLINNGEFCTMPVIQSETDIDAVTRGSDLTSLSAPESYLPSVKLSADVQLSI